MRKIKKLVHIPRRAGTAIIRAMRDEEQESSFLNGLKIPTYFNGLRHPRMSQMHLNKGDECLVVVRHPIDWYKSIIRFHWQNKEKAFEQRMKNPDFKKRFEDQGLKRNKFRSRPGALVGVEMLHSSFSWMCDRDDVKLHIIRFEYLDQDLAKHDIILEGISNETDGQDFDLSDAEFDLVRKLCPYEWEIYNCDMEKSINSI